MSEQVEEQASRANGVPLGRSFTRRREQAVTRISTLKAVAGIVDAGHSNANAPARDHPPLASSYGVTGQSRLQLCIDIFLDKHPEFFRESTDMNTRIESILIVITLLA